MLYRKISNLIENHLASHTDSILLIYGARQIGKTFIIREVGKKLFKNFVEINMIEDANGPELFKNVTTVDDFLLHLSMVAGGKLEIYIYSLWFVAGRSFEWCFIYSYGKYYEGSDVSFGL